ncbi:MAG: RNA polymerase subunit sigma, partial [Cyclobacteriaceae bacterium]|nr:RNA polymerase subunit sigma [Cyclobacteriaceae bacterium]
CSAIHLKYLEEKDGKEICQELGITSSNYWQILHRAKLQLRICIEENWFKL